MAFHQKKASEFDPQKWLEESREKIEAKLGANVFVNIQKIVAPPAFNVRDDIHHYENMNTRDIKYGNVADHLKMLTMKPEQTLHMIRA